MWGRAARRTAVSARSAAPRFPRGSSTRANRSPAATPATATGVPAGSGIQPRVHSSSAAENSFPTGPSFPTVPTILPSRVPAFPSRHADPRPVRHLEIVPRRRPRGDRRGARDPLRHPPQERVPAEPGGGEEQVARRRNGRFRMREPAARVQEVGREQLRPPGHHPAPDHRGDAGGAERVVDLAPVFRRDRPLPDRDGGDPARRAREQHRLLVLRARPDGAGHRVDPLEEAGQFQRLPDVRHRPSAFRGEGLRQPLRVADVVVDEDELADVVAAGEQDGGRAPGEPRGAEEEDLHRRIIPEPPRPVDRADGRLLR